MKKMLVLTLVLGLASLASATTLTWSVSSIDIAVGGTGTVQIVASDNLAYPDVWVGADPSAIASIQSITEIANNAGDSSLILDPTATAYPGWWTVAAADMTEPFDSVIAGAQFDVLFNGLAMGSYNFDCGGDTLTVNVVPEPVTMVLLGLGGLFLRKRK